MKKIILLALFIIAAGVSSYPQSLTEQAQEAYALLATHPETAFENAQTIEQKALKTGEYEAEMWALITLCNYYKNQIDFENLITTSNRMFQRSVAFKLLRYQAIAKYYLFESYLFNKLPNKAIAHLDEGLQILAKADEAEQASLSAVRMNYYIGYSNYYLESGDVENQLKYIKLSGREIENMAEGEAKQNNRYINMSNTAQAYMEMGQLDSAKYYASRSEKASGNFQINQAKFMNLLILAEIALQENNLDEASQYLTQAETLEDHSNHINKQKLYDLFGNLYFTLNDRENYNKYLQKKDSLAWSITHNQNVFLRALLNILDIPTDRKYVIPFVAIIALLIIYIAIVVRKNKTLRLQEATSSAYLQNTVITGQDHHKLIELLKENNTSYMAYFTEVYPSFEGKLTGLNPKITAADVEFCSFLKLKLSTKEIAQYGFIAPKTVRNKKYIIRKKLNIPTEVDIYEFFDGL